MTRLEKYINFVKNADEELLTELAEKVCDLLTDPELTYWTPQPGFDEFDVGSVCTTSENVVVPASCVDLKNLAISVILGGQALEIDPVLHTESGVEFFGKVLSQKLYENGHLYFDPEYVKEYGYTDVIAFTDEEGCVVLNLSHLVLD